MSTTTTFRSSKHAVAGADGAPDEPEFQIRFTPEKSPAREVNSLRWTGWGALRIGPRGIVITARRRVWVWLHREERSFIPSIEIRNVIREASSIRVELRHSTNTRLCIQFWAGDLRAAATIVALLPTAATVEIDEPRHALSTFAPPLVRGGTAVWLPASFAVALAAVLAATVVVWMQSKTHSQTPTATPGTNAAARATATSIHPFAADVRKARMELDRFDRRIDGLSTQFATAFTALQRGRLESEDFSTGLQMWLIPQWQTLRTELDEQAPASGSEGIGVHLALSASASFWQNTLALYANGLRERDSDKVGKAFAQMKRAEEYQRLARQRLEELEARANSAGDTPKAADR